MNKIGQHLNELECALYYAVHILLHLCMNTIIIYACTSILVHWTVQTALHRSVLLTHSICNFGFTNGKMLLLFKMKKNLHFLHSMHSEFGIPTKKTFILWARTQEFERSLIFGIIKILDFHCHVFAWYKPAVLMNESTNQRYLGFQEPSSNSKTEISIFLVWFSEKCPSWPMSLSDECS